MIIELEPVDAYRLLWLVQNQAATSTIWDGYWTGIVEQIKQCLDAQTSGQFFQCSACTDEEHQAMLRTDSLTDYGRNDPAA